MLDCFIVSLNNGRQNRHIFKRLCFQMVVFSNGCIYKWLYFMVTKMLLQVFHVWLTPVFLNEGQLLQAFSACSWTIEFKWTVKFIGNVDPRPLTVPRMFGGFELQVWIFDAVRGEGEIFLWHPQHERITTGLHDSMNLSWFVPVWPPMHALEDEDCSWLEGPSCKCKM